MNEDRLLITVNFDVTGDIEEVGIKDITDRLKEIIQEAIGEIEFGEENWKTVFGGPLTIESKQMSVRYCESPFCEHCGERYDDFGIEISDGNTSWCLDCFLANDDAFTEKEIEEMEKKLIQLKKEYYKNKLEELEPKKKRKK